MRADDGFASADVGTAGSARAVWLGGNLVTAGIWLLGSAVVALAQPSSDRGLAAAGAAVAGVATILVLGRLTQDAERRYFRTAVGTMIAVSISGDWLVQRLNGSANGFIQYGLDTRIALPLTFVLLMPLVIRALPAHTRSRALWRDRALVVRNARSMDWLAAGYVLLIVPDLPLGLLHHAPKTYIAQDLGLIVFFVFAYIAGRAVSAHASGVSAFEFVVVLLVVAAAQALFGFDTTPIFTYVEAASAGAIAFALLKPSRTALLLFGVAVALLARDLVAIKNGSASTTAIEFAAALGVIAYLLVRMRRLMPQWLVVGIAALALAAFLAFTADGAGVLGRYHGTDPSKAGRTYEAYRVRSAIRQSDTSFVLGRGLGGSIDETGGPRLFAESLAYGGRDLAHVQAVHLLPYEFLLKYGLLGFSWLMAFVTAVAILGVRALEAASRRRDPTFVVYAALPLLGIIAALAAATHLQDNPLNAFALGALVTRLGGARPSAFRWDLPIPVVAVIAAAVGVVAFTKPPAEAPGVDLLNIPLPGSARVGRLHINYPLHYYRRYFSAGTSDRNPRTHTGVVVASYPLKTGPELGGPGQHLRPDGVFFELYRIARPNRVAPAKQLPLTIFDFPSIRGLRSPPTMEQGSALFSVNGRSYRAILWVGAQAPKRALIVVDELVDSIRME